MNLEKALFNLPLIHHNSNGLSQPKWQFSDRLIFDPSSLFFKNDLYFSANNVGFDRGPEEEISTWGRPIPLCQEVFFEK